MAVQYNYGTGRRKSAVARVFMKPGNGGFEVNVGSRNGSKIYISLIARTDAGNFSFLNYSQKLCLLAKWHITDLIKKYKTAARNFKSTCPVTVGAGKSPTNMAK